MPRLALLNGLRLITVLAVILTGLPFLRADPALHAPWTLQVGGTPSDAGLAETDTHTHAHVHDDEPDGGVPSAPGHHHWDHSHVTLGLPEQASVLAAPWGRLVRAWDHPRETADMSSCPERPPRPVSVA
jgi:hypothetical protein